MRYVVVGKHLEVTPALHDKVVRKLNKLERYFYSGTEVTVTLSTQKNMQIVEIAVLSRGLFLRAEDTSEDMYGSIDVVVDAIIRQVRKNRTKLEKRVHEASIRFENIIEDDVDDEDEVSEFFIERYKTIDAKPMSIEEAILQMNLIGHSFFVFMNAETEKVCVVYKRKHGNYGLIEAEY